MVRESNIQNDRAIISEKERSIKDTTINYAAHSDDKHRIDRLAHGGIIATDAPLPLAGSIDYIVPSSTLCRLFPAFHQDEQYRDRKYIA